jgi:hypothetical protein
LLVRWRFGRMCSYKPMRPLLHIGYHKTGSTYIAERLAATFPEARVLVVIREQAQMLVSAYKQYVKRGGPGTLEQYATSPSQQLRVPLFDFRFFEYHRLVGYYQSLFGAENVMVLPYELLRAKPLAFLERIGGFAGTNVSPSASKGGAEGVDRTLLRLCYKADVRIPAKLRVLSERRLRALAEELVDGLYAKSNAATSVLAGFDLGAFGYACE